MYIISFSYEMFCCCHITTSLWTQWCIHFIISVTSLPQGWSCAMILKQHDPIWKFNKNSTINHNRTPQSMNSVPIISYTVSTNSLCQVVILTLNNILMYCIISNTWWSLLYIYTFSPQPKKYLCCINLSPAWVTLYIITFLITCQ